MQNIFLLLKRPAIRFILIAGFILSPVLCEGQDSTAFFYLELAKANYKNKEYSKANSNFITAKNMFADSLNWSDWYSSYSGIRKIGNSTKDRTITVDSLEKYINELPKEEHLIRSKSRVGRAYNLVRIGQVHDALTDYKISYSILSEEIPKDTLRRMRALRYISNCYSRLGDHVSSLKAIDKGIEFAEASNNESELCKLLLIKGNSLSHNEEMQKSITVFKESQKLCGTDVLKHCLIAHAFLQLNQLDSASIYLNHAESLLEEGNSSDYERDILLEYKSDYLSEVKKYDEALEIKKALLQRRSKDNLRSYIKQLVLMAQIEEKAGRKEDMIRNAHKALVINYNELDSNDIFQLPELQDELPDIFIIEALYLKANYFKERFEKDSTQLSSKEASVKCNELLLAYFDRLKSTYDSNSSMYRIGNHTRDYYNEIVDFSCNRYLKNKDDIDLQNAFSFAQKANAYVLKNAISERQALELYGLSQDSIDLYTKLQQKANTGDEAADILNFEKFQSVIGQKIGYFNRGDHNDVLSLEEVQKALKEGELVLKYYYFKNQVIAFKVSKTKVEIEKKECSFDLDSLIDRNQYLISDPDNWNEDEYKVVANQLYTFLLGNTLDDSKDKKINHLIIIPDGPIKKVSFSSLVQNHAIDFIRPSDYLIHDYEISYLYYMAQLKTGKRDQQKPDKRFISIGIEYKDDYLKELIGNYQEQFGAQDVSRGDVLPPLEYADDEAEKVADIFNGEVITNAAVTKDKVQQLIKNYNIVHISAHAFVDMDNYMQSYLAFYKDKFDEYRLAYKDILKLGLNSDFVVLSACQTAYGQDFTGESLMSLSRAFIQSGCSASMSSYWNASDKSTMDLMELFYKELKQGHSKSKSLKNAQLEYLKNDLISLPSTRTPYYWSGWAVYGKNASVYKKEIYSGPFRFVILGFVILLFGAIFFAWIKKK
ncbi:MAG: CHAT domain-containing protein [Bacteroidota bacterium]